MKVDVENLSPSREARGTSRYPGKPSGTSWTSRTKAWQKRARVKGFRAGHVPRKVLEQFYKGAVENEVVNRLVDETLQEGRRRAGRWSRSTTAE
jgi:FKBP-type peptidyl-prolyl cis-trans isomerase (trigger factor)